MFVMSVLVALVVGVGSYVIEQGRKEETVATQDRLLSALAAYRRITGDVPRVGYDPDEPDRNMNELISRLSGEGATNAKLSEKIAEATRPYLGGAGGGRKNDAYGNVMRYFHNRGVGGTTLIESAGPDGDFGDEDEDKRRDNIRSDTREAASDGYK